MDVEDGRGLDRLFGASFFAQSAKKRRLIRIYAYDMYARPENMLRCSWTISTIPGTWEPWTRRTQSAEKASQARGTSQSGLTDTVYLRVHGERISEATFETYGCTSAVACGSYVTDWIKGKTVCEAQQLDWDEIAMALDLPLGKEHCAQLAVNALRDALNQL